MREIGLTLELTIEMICLILIAILSLTLGITQETIEKPTIILGVGEQRIIGVLGLKKYSVGGTAIRVHRLNSQGTTSKDQNNLRFHTQSKTQDTMLIKGAQQGISDIWIWKHDGQSEHRMVQVVKFNRIFGTSIQNQKEDRDENSNIYPQFTPLQMALTKLNEVEIIFGNKGALLRGEISSFEELARIHSLQDRFSGQIIDQTEASESLVESGFQQLSKWIETTKFKNKFHLYRIGKVIALSGSIENPDELMPVTRQLQKIYPAVSLDLRSLPDSSPIIHIKVFLLEIKKNKIGALGFSWPSVHEGAYRLSPSGITSMWQLDLAIQALEGEGSLKVLSNPEMVVRAPGEAELFAGGEIPIEESSRYSSKVSWKNYGLGIKLKVTSATRDWVRLDVSTEVSHLDTTAVDSRIPGLQANRIKTQVDANFGTPLLLSGLLKQGTKEVLRGLPFLSKIPVLGTLFGSREFQLEKTELVAILVPSNSLPRAPVEKFDSFFIRGPIPPPRNWVSPTEERALRYSNDFPWNAFSLFSIDTLPTVPSKDLSKKESPH